MFDGHAYHDDKKEIMQHSGLEKESPLLLPTRGGEIMRSAESQNYAEIMRKMRKLCGNYAEIMRVFSNSVAQKDLKNFGMRMLVVTIFVPR